VWKAGNDNAIANAGSMSNVPTYNNLVESGLAGTDLQNNLETVVLENSNVAQLASALYLLVHSLPQEDHYDTDDASAREIYSILVPESILCTVQSPRHRPYQASIVDGQGQAHRTVALYRLWLRVLRASRDLNGSEQAP
jgi:hypothetical protein